MSGATPSRDTTVLITGASGLIGGRLIEHLRAQPGTRVRAASRAHREWPEGVEGYVVDVARADTLRQATDGATAIVNLAAMSERACREDPATALRANAGGTLAWARVAANIGVERFVQVSTYKVYGDSPSGAISEDTLPLPTSHYAITHRASEDYARSQHPNAVILRLANGFGAPAKGAERADAWDIIVNQFCRQAMTDRRIVIRSSGLAYRNFVPLGDVVAAIFDAVTRLPAGTYNLGSPESQTLRAMASIVASVCAREHGFTPAIHTGPADAAAPAPLQFSIERLRAAGCALSNTYDAELRRTLDAAARGAAHV